MIGLGMNDTHRKTENNQNLQMEKRQIVTYPPSGMPTYKLNYSYQLKHKPQKHNKERSKPQATTESMKTSKWKP